MNDNIDNMSELAEELSFPPYEGFPDIELYMDQVLDFLTRSRTSFRDVKLSSAMVNNYIKAEILPRARGKKYSREHLVQLAVIIRLKQVISVKDTGALIKANKLGKTDEEFFDNFRTKIEECYSEFIDKMKDCEESVADFAMSLAAQSYVYKVACEYFIDNMLYVDIPQKSDKTENTASKSDDI